MTQLSEIIDDQISVINLSVHDLDHEAKDIAEAIKKNRNADQLLLDLCDCTDETFQIIVDAICERDKKFIFIDVSSNQDLTEKSYETLKKLIVSSKVEELGIRDLRNVIIDNQHMITINYLALKDNIVIYLDDKTRAAIQVSQDSTLAKLSLFQPRDYRDVTKELVVLFTNNELVLKIIPKLSKLMIYHLNMAIAKVQSIKTMDEYKEQEQKEHIGNETYYQLNASYFSDLTKTKLIFQEIPLFIRYKIMDVCLANNLLHQPINSSTASLNVFKL